MKSDVCFQVMTKPKNALMKQYKFQFSFDDVEFHMTDGALQAVAQTAIKKNTGARGLRSIMESLLLEVRKSITGARAQPSLLISFADKCTYKTDLRPNG